MSARKRERSRLPRSGQWTLEPNLGAETRSSMTFSRDARKISAPRFTGQKTRGRFLPGGRRDPTFSDTISAEIVGSEMIRNWHSVIIARFSHYVNPYLDRSSSEPEENCLRSFVDSLISAWFWQIHYLRERETWREGYEGGRTFAPGDSSTLPLSRLLSQWGIGNRSAYREEWKGRADRRCR